tara:strand:- start:5561 stop:6220 length:660 start_codon:yes stop_codon:yes gene_type:complete
MNPFDFAWQLLKYDEDVYGDPEEYNDMFYEGDGTPRDPRKNPAFDEEDFILDDMEERILDHEIRQLRQSPGFYDKPEPAVTEEERKEEELKQHIADYLQSQKLASQPMDLAWRMLKQGPLSPGERKLLRYIRKPKSTRVAPTQIAADPHSHVQPDNMKDIPGTMNEMGISEANQFNAAMASRPEAKLELQRHMDEVKRRKQEEEAALSEPFVPVHQQNQ